MSGKSRDDVAAELQAAIGSGARLEFYTLDRADLSGLDLSGLQAPDLKAEGAKLDGVCFADADLEEAIFNKASLQGADFTNANLWISYFEESHIERADFTGIHAPVSYFIKARGEGACFAAANVPGTLFYDACLDGADFTGAEAKGAEFNGAALRGATMRGGNFAGADFSGADLTGADFSYADLTGAMFTGAQLDGVTWREAKTDGAVFDPGAEPHVPTTAEVFGISQGLLDLVGETIDYGVSHVRDGIEEFHPFIMARGGEKPEFRRVIAPTIPESVEAARKLVPELPAETTMYALAFDGRLTRDGEKVDAVIVEAGERGSDCGVVFAQCYRPGGEGAGFELLGNPTHLGQCANHFAPGG